jgi:hypothetical protein
VPEAGAGDGELALLFLGSVGQRRLRRGVGQEAGDELVGELAEGAVDLRLQGREGGGVPRELLGPKLLLGREVGADLLQGLVRRRNHGALLGVEPNTHGGSFHRGTSLLLPTIAMQAMRGSPFWEGTRLIDRGILQTLRSGDTCGFFRHSSAI